MPPRVDFYLLPTEEDQAVLLTACILLEKAYLRQNQVFVWCDSEKTAEAVDTLLWTFKNTAFIPHHLQGDTLDNHPQHKPPIQIGTQPPAAHFDDILINLRSDVPPFYKQFARVIELVKNQEQAKIVSRQHYRDYQRDQATLYTHTIPSLTSCRTQ